MPRPESAPTCLGYARGVAFGTLPDCTEWPRPLNESPSPFNKEGGFN